MEEAAAAVQKRTRQKSATERTNEIPTACRYGAGGAALQTGPPAETVFWKKPGAGPSARKRSLFPDGFGRRVSKNDVCFLAEGAEIGFLCCPVWQGKLLKTQIIIFADR